MAKTKNANRLVRGDRIVLGVPGEVLTVGNVQTYWTGFTRVNLTDGAGWTTNRTFAPREEVVIFGGK